MILTPSQIKQLYGDDINNGKFNKGVFDLLDRGLPTNWQVLSNSTLSTWIKAEPNTVRGDYHIFSNDKIALARNDTKIAIVQNIPEKQCILWNKLGSLSEVENSMIGINGTKIGTPTYGAVKFGNGVYIDQNYEAVDLVNFRPGKAGCCECWIKPDWGSAAAGTHHNICDGTTNISTRFLLYWNNTWKNFAFGYSWSGGYVRAQTWPGHAGGDLIHIAAVWDVRGIDGTADLLRIYLNNVLHGSNTSASFPVLDVGVRIGNQTTAAQTVPFDGYIDNMKFWNYAKTDFSDRNIEDAANFIDGDNGILIPSNSEYHHMGCRINYDQTFDLFLDGTKVYSSVMKIHNECFENLEEKFWPDHWWKFNEVSGTVAYGSGKIGNKNGTISGSPLLGQIGKRGTCFDFISTSSQYVDIGDVATNMKSISFWVKLDSTTEEIIALSGATRSIEVIGGTITATGLTSPTIYVDGIQSSVLPDTDWHMITIVTSTSFDPDNMDIGRIDTTYLDGLVDDVRLFINKLSPNEIRQLYEYTDNYYLPQSKISVGEIISGRLTTSIHWWKLNERSGSTVYNYGSIGGDGTPVNSPELGILGVHGSRGYRFDGVNQNINTGTYLPDDTSAMTISCWVYIDNITLTEYIISEWGVSSEYDRYTLVILSSKFSWNVRTTSSYVANSSIMQSGRWYHVVCTFKRNDVIILYVNGQVEASTAVNDANIQNAAAQTLKLGSRGSDDNYMAGKLQDVKMYNFVVTANEARQLYNLSRAPNGEICDARYDRVALSDDEIKFLAESNRSTDSDQDAEERHIRL